MKNKKESSFINMVLTLFLVSLVASSALGYIYELTKEPIAISKLKKQNEAINEVVPKFNNIPGNEMYKIHVTGNDSLECFPAKKDDQLIGTAIKTFSDMGFSERITIMVGILPDQEPESNLCQRACETRPRSVPHHPASRLAPA